MKSLGYFAAVAVVLAEMLAAVPIADPAAAAHPLGTHIVHERAKRQSHPYSPHVYFPASYYSYAQPWLRPQYARVDVEPVATYTRRWRRATTSQPQQPQQRYSVWDLSKRRRRRRSIAAEDSTGRQKRQIEFYDGGNDLSSGFSLVDQRPRNAGRSPGIEPSYYRSNSPYSAWDLSRRRRRRRRRHVRQSDLEAGRATVWDLVRRRKREVTRHARLQQGHRPSAIVE